ncbi:hypothetical protein MHBO_001553 [Bonamia ostreae]|uniref:SANTA domain-containing protein n=1 Tax=Bonamia ostreae TaxID=126728 RepID=A0ABV2AJE6_9EUKA
MRKVTLTNWHFEPKIIATETYKRVALKFYGYLFKDNSRFETNFVARRLSSNQFLTIDGRLIRLTGKLDYNSCKQYFKKDEGKFLKLFELGLPENFMQIIELLI